MLTIKTSDTSLISVSGSQLAKSYLPAVCPTRPRNSYPWRSQLMRKVLSRICFSVMSS